MALSGDGSTLLIGDNTKNIGTGAAYVFVRSGSTWPQQAELTATDGAGGYPGGDRFGAAVALNSNSAAALTTALIGAPGKNNATGIVYVFVPFFGWTQQAELSPTDGARTDEFGAAVALSSDGSTALIGAPFGYTSGTGAAYVFQGSWST